MLRKARKISKIMSDNGLIEETLGLEEMKKRIRGWCR
jgi:hypothetical protein